MSKHHHLFKQVPLPAHSSPPSLPFLFSFPPSSSFVPNFVVPFIDTLGSLGSKETKDTAGSLFYFFIFFFFCFFFFFFLPFSF